MKSTNSDQPLISVIMPTYNHAKFIGEAIESVLNQTYQNLELIVIDNYSEDDTGKTVASYKDNRIVYLKFRNNGIIGASRNYGVSKSKGNVIAFLDSDDWWHPSKLGNQLPCFEDEEIVGVGTDAKMISHTPYYRQINWGKSKNGYIDYGYRSILNANPIMTSSVVVRKDVFLGVGGFDESPDFRFIEDWELWLRMTRRGKFRILGDRLLYYRVFTDKDRDRVDSARRCLKVLEKHLVLGYINAEDIEEATASINHSIARGLLRADNPKCRQYFLKAIRGSSLQNKRLKALIGYLVSFLPSVLRQPTLRGLYAADKICRAVRGLG